MVPPRLPATSNDAQVVSALRGGDERAFLALVKELHPAMLRVASLFVPTREMAEEVTQEAWLGVLKGLSQFEGRSSLRSWIMAIVTNCAKSRVIRESRSTPFSSFEGEDQEPVDPSRFRPESDRWFPGHWAAPPVPWPDQDLASKETLERIRQAIELLPANQRTVITMRDVEGWTSEETCEALCITEVHQRVLLHRARSKVRARLESHFDEEFRR